jgi:hypothetical protein
MKRVRMSLTLALVALAGFCIEAVRMSPARASAAGLPTAQGRYAVTALNSGQYAIMVDTATGKAWYLAFTEYCQSPTGNLRVTTYAAGCTNTETSLPPQPGFEQVSVEGLHIAFSDPILHLVKPSK